MKLNRNKMAMLMIAIMVTSVVMPMASADVTTLDNPPDLPVKVKGDVTYQNGTRVPAGWLVTLTDVTNGAELGNDTTDAPPLAEIPLYEIEVQPPTLIIEGHVIEASVSNDGWSGNVTHTVQSGETAPGSKITMDDIVVQKGGEPVLTTIDVSPSTKTLNIDDTQEFNATAKDQDGNVMPDVVITWTSSNETVGTITDAGLLTALVVGTTTVTAANGTVNGTAAVTVQSGVQPVLTTIDVTPSTKTLNIDDTQEFNATAKDQDGNVMPDVVITWTSSNETVGTITDAGLLTALVVGTTTVTAANGTVNGTAAVTVQSGVQPVLTTIDVSPSTKTLNIDDTQEFNATAKDQDGNVMPDVVITWTSSNETVGTITDAGLLTALVVGTTTVTAANGTVNGTAAVTVQEVVPQNLTTIEVTPSSATLGVDVEKEFTATAKDQDGNVMSGVVINWTSSNTTIGTVSPASATTGDDGTAKTTLTTLNAGTTTVTAANGTINDTASVTVQIAQLTIANLKADPSTYVNTANPTTVSATITSGAPLELIALFAIDTKNHQPEEYMLYVEFMEPIVGGNEYSAEWDATEFEVKGEATSSGTKPVFVIKADEFETIQIPEYLVFGNLTINATTEPEYAMAVFDDDGKLSEIMMESNASLFEPGTTTFTPFAVDATERDTIIDPFEILWHFEDLDPVTLTGAAPDYGISLVKTQVPNEDYVVGLGAVDEAENKASNETTVSVGPTPAPTTTPRKRGGGGGGGGVSDSDGDGYSDIEEIIVGTDPYDPCDPNPACVACIGEAIIAEVITTPEPTPYDPTKGITPPTTKPVATIPPLEEPEKPEKTPAPGFEAVFAIAGLLAVAYLVQRRRK